MTVETVGMPALQVQCTVDDESLGARIAETLVAERLAACCQLVGPIASTYRWQGAVEQAREWLLLAKTTDARFAAVAGRIRALHPYDVPEIVALPIVDGTADYLAWIESETAP